MHRDVKASFLMSPPLVVAYALAGRIDVDLTSEQLGYNDANEPVYLSDVWPTRGEIADLIAQSLDANTFKRLYAEIANQAPEWNELDIPTGKLYHWSDESTYIQKPPFFEEFKLEPEPITDIQDARVLAILGDSVTTDHISPAGAIGADSPAGKYLIEHGVERRDFNTYGARRGNDRIMSRGTFANNRIKNAMLPDIEGGYTVTYPSGEQTTMYEGGQHYLQQNTPLIVFTGKEYGAGSSRDWAAKGPKLLGVKAVVSESYERIHRSNLIGMGILPLQFKEGESAASLGLTGSEVISITGFADNLQPGQIATMEWIDESGTTQSTELLIRIDAPIEVEYYQHGGILDYVIRNLMAD